MIEFSAIDDTRFWLQALECYRERTGDNREFWQFSVDRQRQILQHAFLLREVDRLGKEELAKEAAEIRKQARTNTATPKVAG